ncbi:glycosyl hydrolase [Spongiimicrobium salis]|uniref:glycosyl hydrolase n=1 Tax=Spongiimicrobium salis TaxID=1667022 RepID=UPI00374CD381
MNIIYACIVSSFLALSSCSSNTVISESPPETSPLGISLGISFPPVADVQQRNFAAPLLNELKVKRIRIGENWSLREPVAGNFNWEPLDERMQWAEDQNISILLTLQSNGPNWACSALQNDNSCVFMDNAPFKRYVEQLLQRYPNTIEKIQFGNEWQSDFWYIGNAEQFVTVSNIVYDAIQEYSPETKFVLGGFTTISLRFLAGCQGLIDVFYDDEGFRYDRSFLDNNCTSPVIQSVKDRISYVLEHARYDLVDIHLYDDVDNWPIYYTHFKTLVQKPIICTEFGGPNVNLEPETEEYQANQLVQYIETLEELEVEEAYFFKLVEGSANPAHARSGLIDARTLEKKMSFFRFKELNP